MEGQLSRGAAAAPSCPRLRSRWRWGFKPSRRGEAASSPGASGQGHRVQLHRLYLTQGCPFKADLQFPYAFSRVIGRGTFVSPAKMPHGPGGSPTTCSLMGRPISPNGFFPQENQPFLPHTLPEVPFPRKQLRRQGVTCRGFPRRPLKINTCCSEGTGLGTGRR